MTAPVYARLERPAFVHRDLLWRFRLDRARSSPTFPVRVLRCLAATRSPLSILSMSTPGLRGARRDRRVGGPIDAFPHDTKGSGRPLLDPGMWMLRSRHRNH